MTPRVLLIGDVCIDVTMMQGEAENKLRLGGIFHAARALWALDVPYSLAYIAPMYLDGQIKDFAAKHGAVDAAQVGVVVGAPNVAIIAEAKESGPQGYELLLRDAYTAELNVDRLSRILQAPEIADVLIFPGEYRLANVLKACQSSAAKFHIDIAHGLSDPATLLALGKKFQTVAISTSSELFRERYTGSATALRDEFVGKYSEMLLLKENRGGARLFVERSPDPVKVGAQLRPIVHSVGVGDAFDAVYVALRHTHDPEPALAYASHIAAEYASTTYPDDFRDGCRNVRKLSAAEVVELLGISLPWEERPAVNIYVAAPDFDYVDRTYIDRLVSCLYYHNFQPHLPIRENGQLSTNSTEEEIRATYQADLGLLTDSDILVAVMPYDDPGTIFEMGLAFGLGIPVVVYDPCRRITNPMLTQSAHTLSADLDQIIQAIFALAGRS